MHRTLNVRFLTVLLFSGLLVGAGLLGLYCFQAARLTRVLLAEAEAAADAGRPETAARYFQRYLRARPNDPEALARYGLLLDQQASSLEARLQALRVLERVLGAQPQRHDLRQRLARRAMEIGEFLFADKHLKILLTARPGDSELEIMLAQCALAEKEYRQATAWLEKAIRHAPQRVEPYLQLAALQGKLENPQRRGKVLDALVAARPKSAQAHLARARYHLQRKTPDRAAQDIARAQALAPRDVDVLATAAEIAFARGQFERARECLEKCWRGEPRRAGLYLLRAALEQQAGRFGPALACLRQGLTAVPEANRNSLRLSLADLLVQDGCLQEARATLRQLRKDRAAPLLVDLLEARLLVQQGQWRNAAATVRRLRGLTAPADAALAGRLRQAAREPGEYRHHLALGLSLWTAKGVSAEVEACLRRALRVGDWAPEALAAYVHYLVRTNKKDRVEPLLEQAREKLPPSQAALPLAYGYELLNRLDQAGRVHDAALATGVTNPAVLRGGADFYLRHNQFAKAAPYLRRLLDPQIKAAAPDLQWGRRNLALGLAVSGDYPALQQALALLEKNRTFGSETPDDRRAWAVVLAQHPTRRSEAIALFEQLREDGPLSAGDLFLLVQLHEANRNWKKVRQHLSALLAAPGGKTPGTLAYAAQAALQHGAVDQAQAHLAELAKLEPETFRTIALQARLAGARGHGAAAAKLVQQLAGRDDADLGVLAALLEELGQIEAADTLFRTYVSAGKHPGALLARAGFLGRRQRLAEALDLCQQAWKTCRPAEVAAVAVALLRSGRATPRDRLRVQKWLQAALARTPKAPPLLLALAEVQDLQGRSTQAIRSYRQVLAGEAGNVLALNNLAWLLARQGGQADQALALINKAIELRGPTPQLLDTRAVVHLASGHSRLAVHDLIPATAAEPSASRYFHLAQAYWLCGQGRDAEQALRKARAANLTAQHLHPSERTAYQQLLRELRQK
jgi:tetratricopeptide (TPR) repeat protein